MNKQRELEKLTKEIEQCVPCKEHKSGKIVFGEGSPNASIMFVGEAPGKTEAATGRPFVGRSGKLLRSLIQQIGLKENEIYITSPVKYLPDSGTPTKADIMHAKIHFDKQLAIIDPKVIVLLGSVAAQAVLGEKISVMKKHGEIIEKNGRKYFVTIHPAAGLRFPQLKKKLESDFLKLQGYLQKGKLLP